MILDDRLLEHMSLVNDNEKQSFKSIFFLLHVHGFGCNGVARVPSCAREQNTSCAPINKKFNLK